MASPSVTSRSVPTAYKMPEGFKTTIAFSLRNAVGIFEQESHPASIDGGPAIDTTTQFNNQFITKWPPVLKEIMDVSGPAGYDPDYMDDMIFLVNAQTGSFTVKHPNGASTSYWGYASKFIFQPLRVKTFPQVNYTAVITNWDYTNKVEAGPLHTPAAGT